ncbi:MAG: hypothetical protein ACPGVE_00910 [Flavobacteriales bacterium]
MLETLFPKLKSIKKDKPFLLKLADLVLAFVLVWLVFAALTYIFPKLIRSYIELLAKGSVFLISDIFGLPFQAHSIEQGVGIWYKNFLTVVIDESCSAEGIYKLYLALVLAFAPKRSTKTMACVLGLLSLMAFNTFRIFSLILIKIYVANFYDFFHEHVFVYLLYTLAIALWLYFFNKKEATKHSNLPENKSIN